jgi:carbamoyltransferase
VIKISRNIAIETGEKNLCLAGGVALNCVINGILLRENIFENIWVQPAAGDAGGSLGAALVAWHLYFEKERRDNLSIDGMKGCYIGPEYSNEQIENELSKLGAIYKKFPLDELLDDIAKEISNEKIVGWMQGRMEFGPRSLGNRSILADPRSPSMQKKLNIKVKYRESFRPFAPSIIYQHLNSWFNHNSPSPYMMFVSKVKDDKCIPMTDEQTALFGIDKLNVKRSSIPAVTHIDYSARIQTVHEETNSRYYHLINKFYEITKCPILINTSFNVRGEPIVCTPTDAFNCFMHTDIDILVIGNFLLKKENQNSLSQKTYEKYKLD